MQDGALTSFILKKTPIDFQFRSKVKTLLKKPLNSQKEKRLKEEKLLLRKQLVLQAMILMMTKLRNCKRKLIIDRYDYNISNVIYIYKILLNFIEF